MRDSIGLINAQKISGIENESAPAKASFLRHSLLVCTHDSPLSLQYVLKKRDLIENKMEKGTPV